MSGWMRYITSLWIRYITVEGRSGLQPRRRLFGLTVGGILLLVPLSLVTSDAVRAVSGVSITQQCSLSSSVVYPGSALTATGALLNLGTSAVRLPDVVLAGRRPGGTNEGGPFDDFTPAYNVSLAPGQTMTFTASQSFSTSDP